MRDGLERRAALVRDPPGDRAARVGGEDDLDLTNVSHGDRDRTLRRRVPEGAHLERPGARLERDEEGAVAGAAGVRLAGLEHLDRALDRAACARANGAARLGGERGRVEGVVERVVEEAFGLRREQLGRRVADRRPGVEADREAREEDVDARGRPSLVGDRAAAYAVACRCGGWPRSCPE